MVLIRYVVISLGITACMLGIIACTGPGNAEPKDLTAAERAVRVYQQGQKPECPYTELGTVEATSGSAFSMGTYQSTMARLQKEAAALGATGVIVLDHSKNQMADQATGMAVRCK